MINIVVECSVVVADINVAVCPDVACLLGIFCCRCLLAFCFYMLLILLLMLKLLFYLLWFMKVSMESSRASMKFVWWIGEGVPVNFEAKLWSR